MMAIDRRAVAERRRLVRDEFPVGKWVVLTQDYVDQLAKAGRNPMEWETFLVIGHSFDGHFVRVARVGEYCSRSFLSRNLCIIDDYQDGPRLAQFERAPDPVVFDDEPEQRAD